MSGWYRQTPVGDNLIRVSEPHVHALLAANLWWLRGTDRDIVIDSGLGVVALRDEIPAMFERDPMVVLTHSHLDHAGGAHEFRERAAHATEAPTLAAGPPASLYGAELYQKMGIPDDEPAPELLIDELPHNDYDPRGYRVEPAPLTRLLDDQDRIDLGGRTLTVLHLPGHSPGSIALLEEHTGVLFSGDVIYDDDELIDFLPDSSIPSYRQSMKLLAGLAVSVVHPGHDHSFDQARLHQLATNYLERTN
ncbi:glyoxylase-like metal-dependent hydrolase (beta-lactamase superfamily II) [Asanoa ferruginea]|uniref:Glyoxylase-like metal-dependent hydrolase (Beta-lactamase superfamily II) n=1 Tax=Asanoa ferruginea TaxID=53367 RepID=A0A3D9ZQ02_9ACTN|nr:MBL fold metallo-hydrolase [Asanoa ferruginea]REF99446.1 glyoxylase-like metal-dependent hydrolase (beta-lactamase superfamily II) [Asanoa ferruginea]